MYATWRPTVGRSRARQANVHRRRAQLGVYYDEAVRKSWAERSRSGDPSFALPKAAWSVDKRCLQLALDEQARVDAEAAASSHQSAASGGGSKHGGKGDHRRGGKGGWKGGKGSADTGKGKGSSKGDSKGVGKKRPRDDCDRDDRQPRTPKRA